MNALSRKDALDVYTILVEECGAPDIDFDRDRGPFVQYMTSGENGKEYRFQGTLGFGGKCYLNGNRDGLPYVSCYPEDRTPTREAQIERANERIRELFAEVVR